MIKKFLNNKKGSALIMVLMSLSVLSILGTAILSASVMNLKMKKIDMKSKQSFYIAESGLEEAYVVIEEVVEEAIDKGKKKVEDELEKRQSENLNEDGSVKDEDKLKEEMKNWFEEGYTEYINENIIKDLEHYSYIDDITVKIKDKDSITEFSKSNDEFEFVLESTSQKDKIEKKVESKFLIDIPEYDISYSNKKIETLKENALWTKALLSDKDIIVEGKNVKVKGNIYAYGDEINSNIKSKGIIVGYDGNLGSLNVDGRIVTGAYLQTGEDKSTIEVINNGEVFCNSLSIPNGNIGSNINIKGDVNTYDDIELNGKDANIKIDGSYYGFNDGRNESTVHDKSSGIVINNNDIGTDKSRITITGLGKGKSYDKNYKGTFIAGTSYIKLDNDEYYQTGESVSVKGNYKAYSQVYYDEDIYNEIKDMYENENNEYYEHYSGDIEENISSEDIDFDYFSPLVLVNKIDKAKSPLFKQRKSYLTAVSKVKKNDDVLNLGKGNIDIQNVNYSIGAYIQNDEIKDEGHQLESDSNFKKNQEEYDFYVNAMGDPQVDINDILNNDEDDTFEKKYIADMWNSGKKEETNKKEGYEEVIYINLKANKNYELTGGSKEVKKIKGIIITNKDVHISGEIDFEGTIITQGNIYIQGNENKNFTNTYTINKMNNFILNKISQDEEIRKMFKQTGDSIIKVICDLEGNSNQPTLSSIITVSEWKKTK
ncbi:pilus assembly PilX N-terminal domain-containing protein [Tepidibacter aestuarii]|uniref:pilus assembly PilX N-terminal domain-containing protein n=1 Tax=Tepidibacter aestuarii TaxID=2925782 RepID=UPI0020C02D6E|nr:pilus assembly PilX N-terminal domain-containing protein [Tepidibacter aestuarii]CAH2214668.1 conserved protein of unknown function [Tepidibacter aestuarii]